MKPIKGLFFRDAIKNSIGHIVAEIWRDCIYYPILHGKKDLIIIDAGANVGLTSFFFSEFAKVVYAIEPAKEHMEVLRKMIEFNGLQDIVKPHNFALSIKDDVGELTHYSNTTMYSLYPNIKGDSRLSVTGKEPIALKRIDTFFKEQNIEHCDFLKLDVEGVEYEILGSDSFSNVASKIDQMVVEVHNYADRNPSQIIDSLKLRGFNVMSIPNEAMLFVATRI